MPLPNTFGNVSQAQMNWLDQNFEILGTVSNVNGSVVGVNTIAFTPAADTPWYGSLLGSQNLTGVAVFTNTGAVTLAVDALAALPVYKDTQVGPVALTGGEIVAGNQVGFIYDSTLNTGNGGFHLQTGGFAKAGGNIGVVNSVSSDVGVTLTAAQVTGFGANMSVILRSGTTGGGFTDTTPTAADIVNSLQQVQIDTAFTFRMVNVSSDTQTLAAGANVSIFGNKLTATGAVGHDYIGIVSNVSPAFVLVFG